MDSSMEMSISSGIEQTCKSHRGDECFRAVSNSEDRWTRGNSTSRPRRVSNFGLAQFSIGSSRSSSSNSIIIIIIIAAIVG